MERIKLTAVVVIVHDDRNFTLFSHFVNAISQNGRTDGMLRHLIG